MPYLLQGVQGHQDYAGAHGFSQASFPLQGGGVQCWAVLTPKISEQAHGGETQILSKEGVVGNMY